jgi:hypothetical protein
MPCTGDGLAQHGCHISGTDNNGLHTVSLWWPGIVASEKHEIKAKTLNALYARAAKYSIARESAKIGGESVPDVYYSEETA